MVVVVAFVDFAGGNRNYVQVTDSLESVHCFQDSLTLAGCFSGLPLLYLL